MTKQQQIADFLDAYVRWPRATAGVSFWENEFPWVQASYGPFPAQRPTVDELAHELLQCVEFRALQLGTWLGTTDGKIVADAIEMVMPPFYRQDAELLVAGLQRAAQLQREEGQRAAGRNALATIGVVALLALLIDAIKAAP